MMFLLVLALFDIVTGTTTCATHADCNADEYCSITGCSDCYWCWDQINLYDPTHNDSSIDSICPGFCTADGGDGSDICSYACTDMCATYNFTANTDGASCLTSAGVSRCDYEACCVDDDSSAVAVSTTLLALGLVVGQL